MATVEERKKAKRERAEAQMKGSTGEPILNKESYDSDFIKALNYYSANNDAKDKRKWTETYLKSNPVVDIKTIKDAPDTAFNQVGSMVRLKMRGQVLSAVHEKYIETKLKEISTYIKPKVEISEDEEAPKKPSLTSQEKNQIAAYKLCHSIDDEIDKFIETRSTVWNPIKFLGASQVSTGIAKIIADYYTPMDNELKEALSGTDEQLNEGYGYLSKAELKRFSSFITSIIDACNQYAVIVKSQRAPRAKKEKPAGVLVSKMKYLLSFEELGLKSIDPKTIIGAKSLLVYNVKYKKIQYYHAMDGQTLTVKGTSLLNYDTNLSSSQTLRKPEEFFKGVISTKKGVETTLKALTTKPSVPNGRINEDTVLIRVF